ncbi:ac3f78c5-1ce7-4abb-b5da-2deffa938671 [Sclerotinia trifoliorum]|uniref:Type 1 phosphatases regulator n=1 Tax=Sclerotinia trifoliorum TaxID=28548 RepID=A0A8H2ZQZ4_9HELO|nr:ac3f78c5-1ce7-4abb-b5da-2deffa938671 [Sclerotinia trifoliorum]
MASSTSNPAAVAARMQTHLQTEPQTRGQNQFQGSVTITQSQTHTSAPVLRLRGESTGEIESSTDGERGLGRGRRIQWAEDVVDNEGLGRKKSKVCCIYHAPRPIDESSDESSSDSDDSSSDDDDGGAKPSGGNGDKHDHGDECAHGHGHGKGKGKGKERKRSPNAYERQPNYKGKDKEKGGG